jgi:hypothetical protein
MRECSGPVVIVILPHPRLRRRSPAGRARLRDRSCRWRCLHLGDLEGPGYPSPLPVREGAVYPMPNEQVMALPGIKFVFLKGLSLNSSI